MENFIFCAVHDTIDKNVSVSITKQQNANKSPGKIESKSNLKQKGLPLIGKKVFILCRCGNIFNDWTLLKN